MASLCDLLCCVRLWLFAVTLPKSLALGLFRARAIGTLPSLVVYVSESASKPALV